MNRKFTQEMLIKYLYNETDVSERQAVRAALRNDPELKSEMDQLNAIQELLCTAVKAPSNSSIKIILNHSRNPGNWKPFDFRLKNGMTEADSLRGPLFLLLCYD